MLSLNDTTPPRVLNYGRHEMKPPFTTLIRCYDGTVNICSKCISMFPTLQTLEVHMETCTIPYNAIYEEKGFKISKIESLKTKQLLSLVARMFIENKTVYYEVDDYDFYIIYDNEIFGYFSKFREGENSLNCFLVFPCFQGQGWGTVLVDISAIPEARMKDDGEIEPNIDMKSPEKPYTKKAIRCFRSYWKYQVLGATSVNEIARRRNISVDDAIVGLELNGFDFKRWKMDKNVEVKRPRILSKKVYWVNKEISDK